MTSTDVNLQTHGHRYGMLLELAPTMKENELCCFSGPFHIPHPNVVTYKILNVLTFPTKEIL